MNLLIKSFFILLVICLTTFLFVQFSGVETDFGVEQSENDEVDDEKENVVIVVDGYKAMQLDEDVVDASGIEVSNVEKISIKPESLVYAEIVDIESLVALKTEFEATLAEQYILISDLNNHNKNLQRAEALHKAKSLSARDLDKSRADRDLKSSELRAVNTQLASIKYKVKSLWGEQLASYLFDENKRHEFDLLASYKTSLVLLSLPKNKSLGNKNQKVYINHLNQRESAVAATYLDKANHVNNALYGESYLYLLESDKARAGMKLFAWLEDSGESIEGLFLPDSAVIWYANEAWVYIKQGEELFLRKPLGDAKKITNGWLIENSLIKDNEVVVTRGGQTLLSEEFKWAIPDEDDD
jgi:hypothetical protein